MKQQTFIALATALLASACGGHSYTAHHSGEVYPPRAHSSVTVSPSIPVDAYAEVGIIEVTAGSYADAREHFQRVGADNGCHAVRPFTTRTEVFGGARFTASQTVYLGSCLVPNVM